MPSRFPGELMNTRLSMPRDTDVKEILLKHFSSGAGDGLLLFDDGDSRAGQGTGAVRAPAGVRYSGRRMSGCPILIGLPSATGLHRR
jgi:hypothetical protein